MTEAKKSQRLNWAIIGEEHVRAACRQLQAAPGGSLKGRGLFVVVDGQRVPAKDLARVAYLLATDQPPTNKLKFSSSQSTLDMFARLGFEVERKASEK